MMGSMLTRRDQAQMVAGRLDAVFEGVLHDDLTLLHAEAVARRNSLAHAETLLPSTDLSVA
jgi:hypothetical protein